LARPRNAQLDTALTRAAEEIILERGVASLSVEAVASRAGTTRPAFYRRFKDLPELVFALLLERFVVDLDSVIGLGNLPAELQVIQRNQVRLFGDPMVKLCLAGFLDALHANQKLSQIFVEKFLGPLRAGVVEIIQRSESRGEIPPCQDREWICDLLTGPLLMRCLLPGLPPLSEDLIESTVDSALCALHFSSP
jgi:AcrR family transcriptional regulator